MNDGASGSASVARRIVEVSEPTMKLVRQHDRPKTAHESRKKMSRVADISAARFVASLPGQPKGEAADTP